MEERNWDSFKKQADQMVDLQARKNKDYGNSFNETLDEFGLVVAVARMNDKMKRLKSLYKNPDGAGVDESINDTLNDLAAYALMTKAWIEDDSSKVSITDWNYKNPVKEDIKFAK